MASVRLDGVQKVYPGGHVGVHELTLEVADGEFLVLVGPSGCGKSTALRMVAGLESPTRGRVLLGDRDVTRLPPQRRDIAMVFQNYALYPHKTVRQNLEFGLRMRGAEPGLIAERVAAALVKAGLRRRPPPGSGRQKKPFVPRPPRPPKA